MWWLHPIVLIFLFFLERVLIVVSRFGLAVRLVSGRTSVWYRFGSPFSSERLWFSVDTVSWLCPSFPTETLKWLSSLPILMQESFWWWQCSDRYIISVFPNLHTPFSPSLISLMVSVDVKHHVYLLVLIATNSSPLQTIRGVLVPVCVCVHSVCTHA